MTTEEPRIRDVYRDYRLGKVPFERVIEAADRTLARFEASRDSTLRATESNSRRTD